MRKITFGTIGALLSVICLCVALGLSPAAPAAGLSGTETVFTAPVTLAPTEDEAETVKTDEAEPTKDAAREYTAAELEARFTNMLNLNYCYGENFSDAYMMAACSAISLFDYADDIPGYGIGVNENLVLSFAESFYGVALPAAETASEDAPKGYVMTPACGVGTQVHTVISVTELDEGFEVLSGVQMYYGGDDVEVSLAKSVFVPSPESEFGFNLISCELL